MKAGEHGDVGEVLAAAADGGELLVRMLGRSGAVARLWLECQGGWVD